MNSQTRVYFAAEAVIHTYNCCIPACTSDCHMSEFNTLSVENEMHTPTTAFSHSVT